MIEVLVVPSEVDSAVDALDAAIALVLVNPTFDVVGSLEYANYLEPVWRVRLGVRHVDDKLVYEGMIGIYSHRRVFLLVEVPGVEPGSENASSQGVYVCSRFRSDNHKGAWRLHQPVFLKGLDWQLTSWFVAPTSRGFRAFG